MEKIAYEVPTKQSTIALAKKWKSEGVYVTEGYLTGENWEEYKEETCVDVENNRMDHCRKKYYKENGYKIIPHEKKLEYGYCEEGDKIEDKGGDTTPIIKVTEEGLWREDWYETETAHFHTWDEVKEAEKSGYWKIHQPSEDVLVRMPRTKYEAIKEDDMELVNNS